MPAFYKTTWFFEGLQPNYGTTASSVVSWTETWYQQANGIEDALAFARRVDNGNTWVRKRLGFLHALYQLKWVRVSNTVNARETKLANIPGSPSGAIGGGVGQRIDLEADNTAAQINCCVLADLVKLPVPGIPPDKTHHRRILLRGLSRSMINGNIIKEVGAAYEGLLAFLDYVAVGRAPVNRPIQNVPPWFIRYQSQAVNFIPIPAGGFAINALDAHRIELTMNLGNLLQNQRIAIRQMAYPRGVNRIWTLTRDTVSPGPYVLGKSKFLIEGVWDGTGQAEVVTPIYGPADQYTLIGLRTKHTGSSPFGRTRGRRRAI